MIYISDYRGDCVSSRYYQKRGQRMVSAALDSSDFLQAEALRVQRGCSMAELVREALRSLKE
jgi:hypothetical protein